MSAPNLWNPLSHAAEWLSLETGHRIDVRTLIDVVARSGKMGTPAPTIIKAMMPRRARFALLAMPGHPELHALLASESHSRLSDEFGPIPGGMAYIREARLNVIPLCVNQLLELLMRGEVPVSLSFTGRGDETVWLMPFDSHHMATIDTCGIGGECLAGLVATIGGVPQAESTADRDLRWHSLYAAELQSGPARGAMTRTIKKIASTEGVKEDTAKKGIQRASSKSTGALPSGVFKGLGK